MHEHTRVSGVAGLPDGGTSGSMEARVLAPSQGNRTGAGTCSPAGNAQGSDALAKQVGGDHYRNLAIQPVEFIVKNSIPFLEANAIKYLVRHNSKGGAADIRKAIHYLELVLHLQYGEKA